MITIEKNAILIEILPYFSNDYADNIKKINKLDINFYLKLNESDSFN